MSFIKTLINVKNSFFYILKVTEDFGTDPDPHPDPIVRGTDPDPRIRTKISRIRNIRSIGFNCMYSYCIALYRRRCIVLYLCVTYKKNFRGPKIDTHSAYKNTINGVVFYIQSCYKILSHTFILNYQYKILQVALH
jgi:hypothetical protein